MNYRITHQTRYEYTEPVSISHHAARLEPRSDETQDCRDFAVVIQPEPWVKSVRTDYFGNRVCYFTIQQLHHRLEILSTSRVRLTPNLRPDPSRTPAWEEVAAQFCDPVPVHLLDPCQFVFDSPLVATSEILAGYARESFSDGRPLLEATRDLAHRIHHDFVFDPKATTVATPLEEVWQRRRGVCQDFAHLGVACLRSLGLPARYVSGYLRTEPPAGQPRLLGIDASHAWLSVHCPGFGWVDLDPTNDLIPTSAHITVAYGRDFSDVSPLSGVILGGGQHDVTVGVDVETS